MKIHLNNIFKKYQTTRRNLEMPKKPYIPTRLLQRSSQLRRLQKQKICTTTITQHSNLLLEKHSQSQSIELEHTDTDLQANKTTLPIQLQIEPNNIIDHTKNLMEYLPPIAVPNTYTFKEKLTRLIIDGNIPRNKVTELLHLLSNVENLNELKNLPLDSRILLNCPKSGSAPIIPMENGQYFHLGLKEGLTHLLQQYPYLQQLNVLPVWIAIDGIPILGHEFWPIIGGLKLDTGQILPFVIGVYCGDKKPGNVTEYLNQLIEDINYILDNGFELTNKIYNIKLMGFIADAPARYE